MRRWCSVQNEHNLNGFVLCIRCTFRTVLAKDCIVAEISLLRILVQMLVKTAGQLGRVQDIRASIACSQISLSLSLQETISDVFEKKITVPQQ
jgi:hypothetical protein